MFKSGVIIGKTSDGQAVWSRCDTADTHIHDDFINEEVVRDILGSIDAGDKPFMRLTMDINAPVGRTALVETNPNDDVFYARRGDRAGLSRMIRRSEKPQTNIATVILCKDRDNGGRLTVVAAFPGEQGEPEPWDERVKDDPAAKAKSEAFWATHALIA